MPDQGTYKPILEALLGTRYQPADIPPVDAAGVYALFLACPSSLLKLNIPGSGVLYVGMAELSLEVRNHFAHGDSH